MCFLSPREPQELPQSDAVRALLAFNRGGALSHKYSASRSTPIAQYQDRVPPTEDDIAYSIGLPDLVHDQPKPVAAVTARYRVRSGLDIVRNPEHDQSGFALRVIGAKCSKQLFCPTFNRAERG